MLNANPRPNADLLEGLLERAQKRMTTFKPQEIGNTVWALASLGVQIPPQLSAQIALRSYECVHGFDQVRSSASCILTPPPPPPQTFCNLQGTLAVISTLPISPKP